MDDASDADDFTANMIYRLANGEAHRIAESRDPASAAARSASRR
jgi:hypothetical protein